MELEKDRLTEWKMGKFKMDWPMKFKNHNLKSGQWHSMNGLRTLYHPYFWIEVYLNEFTSDEIERFRAVGKRKD